MINRLTSCHFHADIGVGTIAVSWTYCLYHIYAFLKGRKFPEPSFVRRIVWTNIILTLFGCSMMFKLLYYIDKIGKVYLGDLTDEQVINFPSNKEYYTKFYRENRTSYL